MEKYMVIKKNVFKLVSSMVVTLALASHAKAENLAYPNGPQLISEIRFGILNHDVDNLWSNFSEESGTDFNGEIIFSRPVFPLFTGVVRPNLGISINDSGNTSKIYAGFLWEREFASDFFLNLGIGLAVHDGETETLEENKKQLGLRVLLRFPIEVGYSFTPNHRLSIAFDHISNGYLVSPNEGLDTLGVRYGYRF